MANDPQFKRLVYQEIEKEIDGDYNVLFEHLLSSSKNQSIKESVSVSLDAFKGIKGINYYPQIFIPYYEELKGRQGFKNGRTLSGKKPIVMVLAIIDNPNDKYLGYQLNENGELVPNGKMIDEEYAQNNEVWVISLNERIFSLDEIPAYTPKKGDGDGGGDGSGYGKDTRTKIWCAGSGHTLLPGSSIGCLGIRCHKESWISGKSEVNIRVMFSTRGFRYHTGDDFHFNQRRDIRWRGRTLINMHRGDVKNGKGWNIDRNVISSAVWAEARRYYNYANYVIFEYDPWPTGCKNVEFNHSGVVNKELRVRTSDEVYHQNMVTSFSGIYVDNECIFYTGRAR